MSTDSEEKTTATPELPHVLRLSDDDVATLRDALHRFDDTLSVQIYHAASEHKHNVARKFMEEQARAIDLLIRMRDL
jgi:23S rRNA G2069 N7-methylase RlmK/C1962 C5-methylase RlmI